MIERSRLEDGLYNFMYKSMMYDDFAKEMATGVGPKFVRLLSLCTNACVLSHVLRKTFTSHCPQADRRATEQLILIQTTLPSYGGGWTSTRDSGARVEEVRTRMAHSCHPLPGHPTCLMAYFWQKTSGTEQDELTSFSRVTQAQGRGYAIKGTSKFSRGIW